MPDALHARATAMTLTLLQAGVHAAVRQKEDTNQSDQNNGVLTIVVAVLVAVVVVTAAGFWLLRLLLARCVIARHAAAHASSTTSDSERTGPLPAARLTRSRLPPRDRAVLPGFPPQPPAIVRIQRHVHSAGLSVAELDIVAPIAPFQPPPRDDPVPDPASDSREDVMCPVCLEDMGEETKARNLPCFHAFHARYAFSCIHSLSLFIILRAVLHLAHSLTSFFLFLFLFAFMFSDVLRNGSLRLIDAQFATCT